MAAISSPSNHTTNQPHNSSTLTSHNTFNTLGIGSYGTIIRSDKLLKNIPNTKGKNTNVIKLHFPTNTPVPNAMEKK